MRSLQKWICLLSDLLMSFALLIRLYQHIYIGMHVHICWTTLPVLRWDLWSTCANWRINLCSKNASVIIGRGEEKTTGNVAIIIKYETKWLSMTMIIECLYALKENFSIFGPEVIILGRLQLGSYLVLTHHTVATFRFGRVN